MVSHASPLFVSPRPPSRQISKHALSFFLREVISGAGAVCEVEGSSLRAHSIRGVSTSTLLCRTGRSLRCWRLHLGDPFQF